MLARKNGVAEELTSGWHTGNMPTGRHMGHRGPSIADRARTARAVARAVDLSPIIVELQAAGITSLNAIAAALNERGIPTPAGRRRKAAERTVEATWQRIGDLLSCFSAAECANYIRNAGYASI
jgi:hypothetical protein